ncbi:MAG: NAD(P)-binding domain-containing protein, partial [Pseudomonadales bacterium]
MTQIAFLGAGNIAQAIMGGLMETGYTGNTIHACDPAPACQEKARALGANVAANNDAAIAEAEVVILCVKPNVVVDLLTAVSVPLETKL